MSKQISDKKKESDFTVSVIGLGPWSFSKLKLLRQCPLSFYLKYLIKHTPDAKQDNDSHLAEIGSAVHKILELAIMGTSVDTAVASTKGSYPVLSAEEWGVVLSLRDNVTSFLRKIDEFSKKYPIKKIVPEIRVGITKNKEPTGFFAKDVFIRGIIDLILLLENNDSLIIDHKTGAPSLMGVKNFRGQLDSYKVLVHFGLQKISGASSGVHFVKDNQVVLDVFSPVEDIEDRLYKSLIFSIETAIDVVKEKGRFFKQKGSQCTYCEFKQQCNAGKLSNLELESANILVKYDTI